jgi:serine protease Do
MPQGLLSTSLLSAWQRALRQLKGCLAVVGMASSCWISAQTVTPPNTPGSESAKASELPPPSASARDVFSRHKDKLVQVRVLLKSASEQSSLGSGFVVRDEGIKGAWVVTNYHVISSLAVEPEKYEIELRGTNGRKVGASVVAIDLINDLAILRTQAPAQTPSRTDAVPWPLLALQPKLPEQGQRVFALGNPLELGFLISEGLYNGLVESRLYEQMLFSGSLNSGMSGGPALNEQGQVVGVNVATRRDGEQLSFLVPARYVQELLARADSQASVPKTWREDIARQLHKHQDAMSSKMRQPGFSTQKLAGLDVPTLSSELTKCWANSADNEFSRYRNSNLTCDLKAALFIRSGFRGGNLSLEHRLLQNTDLATPQFLKLGGGTGRFDALGTFASRGQRTQRECRDAFVQPKPSARVYRVSTCLQTYTKYEGLFDMRVHAVQVDNAGERLSSTLNLSGFTFAHAQAIAQQFVQRLP